MITEAKIECDSSGSDSHKRNIVKKTEFDRLPFLFKQLFSESEDYVYTMDESEKSLLKEPRKVNFSMPA